MKSVLEATDVAREVRRGALMGLLRSLWEDAFKWQPTPTCVNERHPLKEIQAWLAALDARH